MRKFLLLTGLALLLIALPAAADSVIYSGVDLWTSSSDGSTQSSFAEEAIPANFFCSGSEPFTGVIKFRGQPLATEPAGLLGKVDTIVHRLDDAYFGAKGIADTRIQVRALAFESLEAIDTTCGKFNVTVVLDGEQPITKMRILRDNEKGGAFFSPISVQVSMNFSHASGRLHEPLSISRRLDFAPMGNGRWTSEAFEGQVTAKGFVLVDTNADGQPDTYLPGTSNFNAHAGSVDIDGLGQKAIIAPVDCHCEFESCGHRHCIANCGGGTQYACP